MDFKARLKDVWGRVREEKVGDLVDKAKFWAEAVAYGADPVEAMHGHLCGPTCLHWDTIPKARQEQLKKAPWNQGET